MAKSRDLESAFDEALRHIRRSLAQDMNTVDGSSARSQLEKLEHELKVQRAAAIERGAVDREWFERTVRWMVEWLPDTELTLIAALGRIVRVQPPALS